MRATKQKILSQSIPLLAFLTVLEITGGQLLNNEDSFISIPFLLIAVPVINGLFGNIGSILGARLSTGLHLGQIELSFKDPELRNNILQTIIVGILMIFILTGLIWVITPLTGLSTGDITAWRFMLIMLGTGILMIVIVTAMSVISAFLSFKKGLDPDNTVTPVVTTTGDLMGITTLVIMVALIGMI